MSAPVELHDLCIDIEDARQVGMARVRSRPDQCAPERATLPESRSCIGHSLSEARYSVISRYTSRLVGRRGGSAVRTSQRWLAPRGSMTKRRWSWQRSMSACGSPARCRTPAPTRRRQTRPGAAVLREFFQRPRPRGREQRACLDLTRSAEHHVYVIRLIERTPAPRFRLALPIRPVQAVFAGACASR